MKKKFILVVVVVVAVFAAVGLYLRHGDSADRWDGIPGQFQHGLTEQEIRNTAEKWKQKSSGDAPPTAVPPKPMDPNRAVRVAIGGLGMADDIQNRQLGDLAIAGLRGAKGLELVDRQSLSRVLAEQQHQLSGLVRAQDAIRMGQLLRADWFLFGTTATANGSNAIVARLVDAHTGILRDVTVVPRGKDISELAGSLAGFVRKTRQTIDGGRSRKYVAIGAFENLSLNNRLADFPAQVRSHLIAGFRDTDITLLEREYVDAMLEEVHLDLAGLTEASDGDRQPLQAGFYIVTGRYQFREDNGAQVDLVLEFERVFGMHRSEVPLKGALGEPLFRQIQEAIQTQINQKVIVWPPSRRTEAAYQLETGRKIFDNRELSDPTRIHGTDRFSAYKMSAIAPADRALSAEQATLRRQNLAEALRAFQTVLVMEPTNREAKIGIASCLSDPLIGKQNEARNYYLNVLEESMDDQWAGVAQGGLGDSFYGEDDRLWYAEMAKKTVNPKTAQYFKECAHGYLEEKHPEAGGDSQAKTELLRKLQEFTDYIETDYTDKRFSGKTITIQYTMPVDSLQTFAETFGTNKEAGTNAIKDLFPELETRFSGIQPYLQEASFRLQLDTNLQTAADFQKLLSKLTDNPSLVKKPNVFWPEIHDKVLPLCLEHGFYPLAAFIVDRGRFPNAMYVNDEKLILALEYFEHEKWKDALAIFQCYSNRPIPMSTREHFVEQPYIEREGPILTGRYAAACEGKLGLTHAGDPREFTIGKPCLPIDDASTFAVDSTGLWIAGHAELRHFDFDFKLLDHSAIPMDSQIPCTSLLVTESKVWIGTAGAGIVEMDKAGQHFRRYTVDDGMLMNSIGRLQLHGSDLWIGYETGTVGGLGKFDFGSQSFTNYISSLETNRGGVLNVDPPDKPPRHSVLDMSITPTGDILALVFEKGVQRFSPSLGRWNTLTNRTKWVINCVASTGQNIAEGIRIQHAIHQPRPKSSQGAASTTQTNDTRSIITLDPPQTLMSSITSGPNNRTSLLNTTGLLEEGGIDFEANDHSKWETLLDGNGIPNPPQIMTSSEGVLWVGGEGYVSLIDLKDRKVRRYCYIPAKSVQQIEVGGGSTWVRFGENIFRINPDDLQ